MLVNTLLVLGGGSAGFLAAITARAKVPNLRVILLRSKDIPIIGVGEGTTPTVPHHLHGYLGIDMTRFYREAQPTWKLGIRFLWGPRPYFNYTFRSQCDSRYLKLSKNTGYYYGDQFEYGDTSTALMTHGRAFVRQPNGVPLIDIDAAYHLENETFVGFLENYAYQVGVEILDDTVEAIPTDEHGIAGLKLSSGRTIAADLYVDCSGFGSLLLGQTLREQFISFQSSLFCDRAVLGPWQRGADEPIKPYTTAETMDSGWCWQIEHEQHITRGYVYSSNFISDADAEREFRAKNPKIEKSRVVKFLTGRYERAWVKNVLAIGNAGGFVEPLESTSLGAICADCQALAEILKDNDRHVSPGHAAGFNARNSRAWDSIRQFLAMHYKFNTRLDTPFWRAARADTDLAGGEAIVDFFQQNGPSTIWRNVLLDKVDVFNYEGYLAMLIGQKVPYESTFQPSPEELAVWRHIQASNRAQGERGLTVAESLEIIRRPEWQWDPDFYKRVYGPTA
jgi:tryptophan halogenase